ncbi:Gfo/Idh/MocA family protein [Naasia sp. SYSU D00057]|uniref:Gfo/Idh/MocA family protein n=1 Tax=Naasia sp. SYSU D00057 TaxID=2817380 RepID=UPI001B30391F|nr:Gfo/Idh/MocA family oxidoreductase [Naasia sp. SYSU D00057]
MTEGQQLRAGILGTGGVAVLHARALAELPGARLVAVSDVDPDRAAAFAAEHGAERTFGSLEGMLAEGGLDVLHICTPPPGHADQAKAAFAAGAHAIVEKPPALTLAEVADMQAAADAADRRLAVVFQQRSGTAAAHVKRLLESGALGRPLVALCQTLWHRIGAYYEAPWRGTWAGEGGGPTFSLAIHQIDLLAHLLGEWSSASSRFWRLDRPIETEDVAVGSLVFESGAVASVVTSVLSPRQESRLRIDTEKATVELVHLYGHSTANWTITPAPGIDEDEARSWAFPDADVPSGHDALLADVYAALRDGAPVPPSADEPSRALSIVAALYASAREGAPIGRAELLARPELGAALRAPLETPPA